MDDDLQHPPEEIPKLLAKLDVDVTDANFWELGLNLLGEMVAEAESLAAAV